MIAEKSPVLQKAYDKLVHISADEQKRLEYEARLKAIRDYNTQMQSNWEDGNREGHQAGRREGEVLKTISQIQKKVEKNIEPVLIADMLEEELVFIEQICHLIKKYPEADKEALFDYWTAQQKEI